jgi:RNA polymerase-binding transcription factor DksA
MISLSQRKSQLEARLSELQARLHRIEDELDIHTSPDWEDIATEREAEEVLEDLGSAGQLELRQISAALQRIEAGEYGACTKCGAAIGEERLDLLPHTPFCRRCAG